MLEEEPDCAQMYYYTGSLIVVCKSEKMDPPNFSLSRRFIGSSGRPEVVSRNVDGRLSMWERLPFGGEDGEWD